MSSKENIPPMKLDGNRLIDLVDRMLKVLPATLPQSDEDKFLIEVFRWARVGLRHHKELGGKDVVFTL